MRIGLGLFSKVKQPMDLSIPVWNMTLQVAQENLPHGCFQGMNASTLSDAKFLHIHTDVHTG